LRESLKAKPKRGRCATSWLNSILDDQVLYSQIKADYDRVRDVIRTKGFTHLSGTMGVFVQPRTKGAGNGSTSRAFYARTALVGKILGID